MSASRLTGLTPCDFPQATNNNPPPRKHIGMRCVFQPGSWCRAPGAWNMRLEAATAAE